MSERGLGDALQVVALRDEALAFAARAREGTHCRLTYAAAERAFACCARFLAGAEGVDDDDDGDWDGDGDDDARSVRPDAARQTAARELGLIGALVDAIRAPGDRAAVAAGGAYLDAYRATGKQRDVALADLGASGLAAHRLAMRALRLSFAGNRENEFYFFGGGDGTWIQALIAQSSLRVGSVEALSELLNDNEALLDRHVNDGLVDDFARIVEALGPRDDALVFFRSIASCGGAGVASNQERCSRRFGLCRPAAGDEDPDARRSRLLLECRAGDVAAGVPFPTATAERDWGPPPRTYLGRTPTRELPPAFLRWSRPPAGAPWAPGVAALFWAPGDLGVRVEGGAVVAGLAADDDGWVRASHLLWVLDEDACCEKALGASPRAVDDAAARAPAIRAALDRQRRLARFFVTQIQVFAELSRSRSYNVIRVLEADLTFPLVFGGVVDEALPLAARAAFASLLLHLHVDRFPHERHVGRASLPETVFVRDAGRGRGAGPDYALDHFAATPEHARAGRASCTAATLAPPPEAPGDGVELVGNPMHRRAPRKAPRESGCTKFYLVKVAVENALVAASPDDGAARCAYTSALVDLMGALVSFGAFPASRGDVSETARRDARRS